ncbi:MAG: 7-carboxy-7-deazaguanine synthase QueE [Gammaproteobacteria bacterium]|nr:7-carboxy-7-deazaguanine synthase QueE [Gammaproteobacteria bacterium]
MFYSLQGETRNMGLPTVFVRFTGCPLRCGYCDTEYAFQGGQWMLQQEILDQVASFSPNYVTVTGGEPLAQRGCRELLTALCDAGYQVSLETSGALDIGGIDPRVSVVMDIKTPGSGEVGKFMLSNVNALKPADEIKFVITDRPDYDWAKEQIEAHKLVQRCEILVSPVYGRLNPAELAQWVLDDRLPVRLQVQLHKLLWGDAPGH